MKLEPGPLAGHLLPHPPPQMEAPELDRAQQTEARLEPPWRVLVHNDEVTPYDFVIHVLERIYLLSEEIADHVALTAQEEGTAIVVLRPRDEAQRLVTLSHASARGAGWPLTFSAEPEP